MGLHIAVYNEQFERHPTWNSLRRVSDKEFVETLFQYDVVSYTDDGEVTELIKPANIGLMREMLQGWAKRYHFLLDLVEEGWWISISY